MSRDLAVEQVTVVNIAAWDPSDDWLTDVGALLKDWAHECQGEPAVGMWVLRSDAVIIGCVGMRRRRFNGRLELCRLHVRPELRGQGLSRRLIRHALDHAHAHCPERVTAQVREGNVPAVAALSRFEFREISRTAPREDATTILLLDEANAREQRSGAQYRPIAER